MSTGAHPAGNEERHRLTPASDHHASKMCCAVAEGHWTVTTQLGGRRFRLTLTATAPSVAASRATATALWKSATDTRFVRSFRGEGSALKPDHPPLLGAGWNPP